MRRDEVGETVVDQDRIKNIDAALVHEEALKQALDNDQSFAKEKHNGAGPSSPAMEDHKEGQLRPENQPEENGVDKERNDGQRNEATVKERIEIWMSQKVVDPFYRICCCSKRSSRVTDRTFDGRKERLQHRVLVQG